MILLIDVGNTAIKYTTYNSGIFSSMCAIRHSSNSDTFHQFLLEISKRVMSEANTIASVLVSNVAGERIKKALLHWCQKSFKITPRFAFVTETYNGLVNAYKPIGKLGIDRWLALLASAELYDIPMCVVDVGTAVTIDAIDENKTYIGGIILPGLNLMRSSLQRNTDAITIMQDQTIVDLFARDTQQGVITGTTVAISATVEKFMDELYCRTSREVTCVLTGGGADQIKPYLSDTTKNLPDLVLRGLFLWGKDYDLG